MPAISIPPVGERILRARAIARDGWLFLGIGLATPCVALIGARLAESNETISFLGIALAACGVMFGLGLYKLSAARRAGLRGAATLAGSIAIWLYAIAALFAICGYFMPNVLRRYVQAELTLVSWTVPTVLAGIAGLRIARKKDEAEDEGALLTAKRAACALALSYLFIFYIIGVLACTDGFWLLRGGLLYNPGRDSFWEPRHAAIRAAIAAAWVLSIASYAWALSALNLLRRCTAGGVEAGWLLVAAWLYLLPMLAAACCFCIYDTSIYGGVIGALLAVTLAGLLGALLSGVWRPGRARLRWWMVTLSIAAVLLLVAPMAVSVGLLERTTSDSARYFNWIPLSGPRPAWMQRFPEFVRAPLMRQLARLSYFHRYCVYAYGLSGIEDLKAECMRAPAVQPYYMPDVWEAWWQRDAEHAMSAALAIPPAVGATTIPFAVYDMGAGYIIGKYAAEPEIFRRLQGNYPDLLVTGILMGVEPLRKQRYSAEFVKLFETRSFNSDSWNMFARTFPDEAAGVIRERIKQFNGSTALNARAQVHTMWALLYAARYTNAWVEAVCAALKSSDLSVVPFGLNESRNLKNPEVVRCLLALAEGAHPGWSAREQAQAKAAENLHEMLDPRSQFSLDADVIASTCKKAREYLEKHNSAP